MTLEKAKELFEEARDYQEEKIEFIPMDSEIRKIAEESFGYVRRTTIDRVIADVFFTLAKGYWRIHSDLEVKKEDGDTGLRVRVGGTSD